MARDTVFSAVMIVCNGIVRLCLLAGGEASVCDRQVEFCARKAEEMTRLERKERWGWLSREWLKHRGRPQETKVIVGK